MVSAKAREDEELALFHFLATAEADPNFDIIRLPEKVHIIMPIFYFLQFVLRNLRYLSSTGAKVLVGTLLDPSLH